MTLFRGSRYRRQPRIDTVDAEGQVEAIYEIPNTTVEPPSGSRPYVMQAGDTFEKLAESEYGDANKWYVIANANKQYFWPLDVEAGDQILIPPRSYAALF